MCVIVMTLRDGAVGSFSAVTEPVIPQDKENGEMQIYLVLKWIHLFIHFHKVHSVHYVLTTTVHTILQGSVVSNTAALHLLEIIIAFHKRFTSAIH